MPLEQRRISQRELTLDPGAAFQAVRRGETVIVENRGRSCAAIVDFDDLQILRAVIGYYVHRPRPDPEAGLPDKEIEGLRGQDLVDVVLCHYLARTISLARAAQALGLSWVDLRSRLTRLGIPVRTGPKGAEGIRQDALVAESIAP